MLQIFLNQNVNRAEEHGIYLILRPLLVESLLMIT